MNVEAMETFTGHAVGFQGSGSLVSGVEFAMWRASGGGRAPRPVAGAGHSAREGAAGTMIRSLPDTGRTTPPRRG
jgi:hypothetical protein